MDRAIPKKTLTAGAVMRCVRLEVAAALTTSGNSRASWKPQNARVGWRFGKILVYGSHRRWS
jgi:hypothetical protein